MMPPNEERRAQFMNGRKEVSCDPFLDKWQVFDAYGLFADL
jgi:hypothetical protein